MGQNCARKAQRTTIVQKTTRLAQSQQGNIRPESIFFANMNVSSKPKTFLAFCLLVFAQETCAQVQKLVDMKQKEVAQKEAQWQTALNELKDLKLTLLHEWLDEYGAPTGALDIQMVKHKAMVLSYSESHEQPAWVYHVIMPDIVDGTVTRTNDFRPDTIIATGTAIDEDFFIKTIDASGKENFRNFGYDRGHLAPSADFRWHADALSESYFYSNIAPQLPEFNRESWAEIEEVLRNYVFRTSHPLMVVTGALLTPELKKVPESVNEISVPEWFFKVAYDPVDKQSVAFWIPHRKNPEPTYHHMRTVDEVEQWTGLDFFPKLNNAGEIESQKSKETWFPGDTDTDVQPLTTDRMPKKAFNTAQAIYHENSGKEVTICGTVVSTFVSKKGNVFLYLDRSYPRQYFSVMIGKDQLRNLNYAPEVYLKGKAICATGKVSNTQDKPAIFLESDRKLMILEQ